MFNDTEFLLLLYLILAHVLSDFVLQTDEMVASKSWVSKHMLFHISTVFFTTWALTGKIWWALLIAPIHYLIDGLKITATHRKWENDQTLFFYDQLLHCLSIIIIWAGSVKALTQVWQLVKSEWFDIKGTLIVIGYITVIWPIAFIIKFTAATLTNKFKNGPQDQHENEEKSLEHGGKLIGQFERIIIFTLVLLSEYQAIGFLITGKSILRFADQNGKYTSEYVLVGTMMSYALAILVGVIINSIIRGCSL